MKIFISATYIGLFAHDEKGTELSYYPFVRKSSGDAFMKTQSGTLSDEEKEFISGLEGGKDDEIIFEIPKKGYASTFPNVSGDIVRDNPARLAVKKGFAKNANDYYDHVYKVNLEMSRAAVKQAATEDRLIVNAVTTIDELESTANTLSIKLKEWYGLYFPEIVDKIKTNEKLASLIAKDAHREAISEEDAKDTIGGDYDEMDIVAMQDFAVMIDEMHNRKKSLEKYVSDKTSQVMPNTCQLITPLLAARLLSEAGNLKKLSGFPSSTIQVLGAEKALFRHIQGHGDSPKHGTIFQSPLINQAPKKKRGKAARSLASKLSIALKMDYFDRELTAGPRLKEELDEKLRSL